MNEMTRSIAFPSLISLLLMFGCAAGTARPTADDMPRTASYAIAADAPSTLRETIYPLTRHHTGNTGVKLIPSGEQALRTRLAMIRSAEHSLDLQYYIVENDDMDKLVLGGLLHAADRGVRVRLLVDSFNFTKSDPIWPLLNSQKNIDVRIFNPFVTRDETIFQNMENTLVGLHHYSRRMHNKILIADNQVAIMGGRNLGDSYFGAGQDFNFHDIDLLTIGPVVPTLSTSFDRYWNDDESFPLVRVLPRNHNPAGVDKLRQDLEEHWKEDEAKDEISPVKPLNDQLTDGSIKLLWAKAELAADSPTKLDHPSDTAQSKPGEKLMDIASGAQKEFVMVSPYFVPGDDGVEWLEKLAKRGVKVRVLTNSLASTDAVAAHTGYRTYRKELLDAGIELYEMKPRTSHRERSHHFGSNAPDSLHSKLYMVDQRDVFIGSFNFDQRSLHLNTEQLLVIHSPELAGQVEKMFDRAISSDVSFKVVEDGSDVEWQTTNGDQTQIYHHEPKAGFFRRLKADFIALFPLEDQL